MKLAKQTIWITGASSGVGEGMATVFHREGANLILSGRREAELERVAADCAGGPGRVTVVPFDITDAVARESAARRVLDEFERIDILVNNAGIGQRSLAKDTSLDVDRRIMEVDFFAPVALTKLVLPRMIEQQGGHLLVTSSVAGKHAVPLHTAYCAAKHALHGYFDTLRVEHLKDNIAVTLLVIAGIRSDVFQHALIGDGSEYGDSDWGDGAGMSAEACAERVVEAIVGREREVVIGIEAALQALALKDKDPEEFIERMAKMMEWMLQGRRMRQGKA
ncbi:MAG: SDR family NAD(P)-dependent oxidoreductase [Gammaproteobacteria bacterium]|nr:MAG: SDR family NAD(P)-dependent oxidoreductase [Gammaproteobacteria bacterium]